MNVPKTCYGVKCMQTDCQNLASHKISEVNIWDKNDIDEINKHKEFQRHCQWTTYLCSTHFMNIMKRETKYYSKEDGVETRFEGVGID
jgi:hypothetical protein